jgi:hypothetical protein
MVNVKAPVPSEARELYFRPTASAVGIDNLDFPNKETHK